MTRYGRAGLGCALALGLAATLAAAPPAAAAGGKWLETRDGSCKIWDAAPLPGEALDWTGGCENGKAAGKGMLTWYLDGQPNGHYKGRLKAGHVVGKGTYTDHNGFRYQGDMGDNGPDGVGVAEYPSGMRYIGEWKNGKLNGNGVLTWPEGDRFEGTFKNGKPDGKGVYVTTDGLRHEQLWKNGKQVKK